MESLEEFNGLLVKILLTNNDQVTGVVSRIEPDLSHIILLNAMYIDRNGSKKHFAEKRIRASDVEDLDVVTASPSTSASATVVQEPKPAPRKGDARSWIKEDVKNIQGEEFDFEANLKLFDKARFTQEQKNKLDEGQKPMDQGKKLAEGKAAPGQGVVRQILQRGDSKPAVEGDQSKRGPIKPVLDREPVKKSMEEIQKPSAIVKPTTIGSKSEMIASMAKMEIEPQGEKQPASMPIDKQLEVPTSSTVASDSKLSEDLASESIGGQCKLGAKRRRWLPTELCIENASFSAAMLLRQKLLNCQAPVKLNVFCNALEPAACSLAIATVRQLLLRADGNGMPPISVCVYLENELFLYSSHVLTQLKYFHEAGGEISCITEGQLKRLERANTPELYISTSSKTTVGSDSVIDFGICMESIDVGLFKKAKTVLVASADLGKLAGASCVLLNDGHESFAHYVHLK